MKTYAEITSKLLEAIDAAEAVVNALGQKADRYSTRGFGAESRRARARHAEAVRALNALQFCRRGIEVHGSGEHA